MSSKRSKKVDLPVTEDDAKVLAYALVRKAKDFGLAGDVTRDRATIKKAIGTLSRADAILKVLEESA